MANSITSTTAPMSALPAATAASSRWLWWLSRLAFLLFLMAVAALLWLSDRNEAEDQRATLISDMLWLEQDMRFDQPAAT